MEFSSCSSFYPPRKDPLFRVEKALREAVEIYKETPCLTTIALHATLSDNSVFFCVRQTGIQQNLQTKKTEPVCISRIFVVPRQQLQMYMDPIYGRFVRVQVIDQKEDKPYWLMVDTEDRHGFILPFSCLFH